MVDVTDPVSSSQPSVRYGPNGQRLCKANHGTCRAFAMQGQEVCKAHGGSAGHSRRAARLRLAGLVDPAIATLAKEMARADNSSDRQRAANSILDRAGFARVSKVESEDARAILLQRLLELQEERPQDLKVVGEAVKELTQGDT